MRVKIPVSLPRGLVATEEAAGNAILERLHSALRTSSWYEEGVSLSPRRVCMRTEVFDAIVLRCGHYLSVRPSKYRRHGRLGKLCGFFVYADDSLPAHEPVAIEYCKVNSTLCGIVPEYAVHL